MKIERKKNGKERENKHSLKFSYPKYFFMLFFPSLHFCIIIIAGYSLYNSLFIKKKSAYYRTKGLACVWWPRIRDSSKLGSRITSVLLLLLFKLYTNWSHAHFNFYICYECFVVWCRKYLQEHRYSLLQVKSIAVKAYQRLLGKRNIRGGCLNLLLTIFTFVCNLLNIF